MTKTEYRFIDWRGVFILKTDLPATEKLFSNAGWTTAPMATYAKVHSVAPRTEPYEHTDNYEVLKDFSKYVAIPGARIILEKKSFDPTFKIEWVHIIYDGNGGFKEVTAPKGQWESEGWSGVA